LTVGESFKASIRERARELGFDLCRVAACCSAPFGQHFSRWLQEGNAGEMDYMARTAGKRLDPDLVLPGTRSILVVAVSYHTVSWPPGLLEDRSRGLIARYAWGLDYHRILLPRLQALARFIQAEARGEAATMAYVDTGPVLEKAWAHGAGLGFLGKNTCLISPRYGSFLFLGTILTTLEIEPDPPVDVGCGTCARCMPACPTGAFPAPYVLDARRCISYLTIELKGPIPHDLRPLVGNWIFGCDLCQEVCPWNKKFSQRSPIAELYPSSLEDMAPKLVDVIAMDDATFRVRYRKRPLWRAKRRGLLRNAAVALGNWGDPIATPALVLALEDAEPLVRGHAAWALGKIGGGQARKILLAAWMRESDPYVCWELERALEGAL
jgi:epoxyqueuosine reductase